MKEHICQTVSKEKLVAYADGELSLCEARQIAEHIATCPDCRAVTETLKRSLEVTQAIWRTSEALWPEIHSFDRIKSNRWPFKKVAAVAAGILIVLGAGAVWQMLSRPTERARTSREQALVAEIKRKIADSGDAARLLAAAELLSKYPETEASARQRYRHIVETYPETAAAATAKRNIQLLRKGD